jgi:hypothetical protein
VDGDAGHAPCYHPWPWRIAGGQNGFKDSSMTENNRGDAPSRGGPGGGNRDRRGGGRDGKPGGGRHKGGGFGKGPARHERAETYESLKELTRGEGFRIDKYVLAEKKSHKPVKTEYRLTREGLTGVHSFPRLVDAQNAATAPLPEPEPEVVEEIVELMAEADATEGAVEAPAEEATDGDSVEHVAEELPSSEDGAN